MAIERELSESVEHQQDDGAGSSDGFGKPGRVGGSQQRRHECRDAIPVVVREDRIHRRRLPITPHDAVGVHRARTIGYDLPCARDATYPHREHERGAPMKVSTRGDYAARALLSLALHGEERPTSVKEIAERTTLPQPYLEQILLAVKGAGLVRSKRGVGGGYVLARSPESITLADIIAAVEGPAAMPAEDHDHCEGHCVLQEVWVELDEESRKVLARATLADLVRRTLAGHT